MIKLARNPNSTLNDLTGKDDADLDLKIKTKSKRQEKQDALKAAKEEVKQLEKELARLETEESQSEDILEEAHKHITGNDQLEHVDRETLKQIAMFKVLNENGPEEIYNAIKTGQMFDE